MATLVLSAPVTKLLGVLPKVGKMNQSEPTNISSSLPKSQGHK